MKFYRTLFSCTNWQYFFRGSSSGDGSKLRILWLIEVQMVFLMINYDLSYRLGYVWGFFDTAAMRKSIFHCWTFDRDRWFWRYWDFYKHMMRRFINFLKVSKTIGRPLNYEDLDFEILHVLNFTERLQITNLRSSRNTVSPIWRKFDHTFERML